MQYSAVQWACSPLRSQRNKLASTRHLLGRSDLPGPVKEPHPYCGWPPLSCNVPGCPLFHTGVFVVHVCCYFFAAHSRLRQGHGHTQPAAVRGAWADAFSCAGLAGTVCILFHTGPCTSRLSTTCGHTTCLPAFVHDPLCMCHLVFCDTIRLRCRLRVQSQFTLAWVSWGCWWCTCAAAGGARCPSLQSKWTLCRACSPCAVQEGVCGQHMHCKTLLLL